MALLERGLVGAALLITGFAHADTPGYGKVETFQPGKKYNCVPTPDHKAWDCNESGKASPARAETAAPPPTAAAAPAAEAPSEPAPKASALPSYLTNSATRGQARAAAPAPAREQAPAPAPPIAPAPASVPAAAQAPVAEPARVATPESAPARAATQTAAAKEAAAATRPPIETPPPMAKSAPVETPPPATKESSTGTAAVSLGNREFLELPADQYVLELDHADSAVEFAAPALSHGQVYKLHLRQNGSDRWLLLWGAFDNVESARAARGEASAGGIVTGWPRRIGPLQAEARRASE